MRTVTATVGAFLTGTDPYEVERLNTQEPEYLISGLVYSCTDLSSATPVWPRIGTATITVEIPDEKETTALLVASLRDQQNKLALEHQAAQEKIAAKIQNLLSLPAPKHSGDQERIAMPVNEDEVPF